jgi:hypothetical protein
MNVMLANYVLGKGPHIIASDSRRAQKLQWNYVVVALLEEAQTWFA